ncbi:flagellar hook protein FlgE [Buchnera aphidicola str. APS (Acyrthosiphon pisum)]|nr:flagellar hook protein FlgE [Buchnera aphidicola]ADP66730.1 flagellar hook protein FlgE [Buchnera aphidicola str. TLW03 (Acyrthosiphon pisum)]ADP67833.1 flagellar hook protein FlgE [Buchnera aphidicola str. JF98 (Acyrthosiphon pisum)]OQX99403.1 MAG: flagellar biosynthesis protein FlgE [Erwiniaceae bacterium 4572_131]ACL30697.1 flagellar hook protein FlgE [Buchnera aphidicola str. 5A (Acyrthosiphon pisum)]ADP66160.1 flagellar hook protein FlgE [Buchnera aphidicola str. LL01 (Acyrthosiphon pi
MSNMIAISGLLANNDYMEIISNNIANASTIGYKSRKPLFFDMFSHSFYSNTTNGYGVGISSIIQNFNNGMLVETGRDLDLGIIKDGFFRLVDSQGHVYYTRDGQFFLDKDQNIINIQGMYLTGLNTSCSKSDFNNRSNLEPINLKNSNILKNKPTSEIMLKAFLNRNTESKSSVDNSDNKLSKPEDYMTYISIYNKEGKKEDITVSFNKKETNKWTVNVESNDSDDKETIKNSFDLTFNDDGELTSDNVFNITSKDSKKYENITLNLTGTIEQSNSDVSWEEHSQNGYPQGNLKTFDIVTNGEIIGTYCNQKQQTIGQILLSKFINPEKLQPESGNLWSATAESGEAKTAMKAGIQESGVLSNKTLEVSNVDLNKELINMIIAQRNYQSNAQSFKTEDKIINTLINLQ